MAARAGIRFTTRGAGQTIGKVRGVGSAFGGLGKSSKSASFGIGQVAYRLYNTLARIAMVRRGVTGMSREVGQAENKWRGWGAAMGGPFVQVLAGVSKKFAEMRRTIAFYAMAIKDYLKWGKKAASIGGVITGGKAKAAPVAEIREGPAWGPHGSRRRTKEIKKNEAENIAAINKGVRARERAARAIRALTLREIASEKARVKAIRATAAARGKAAAGMEALAARQATMVVKAAVAREATARAWSKRTTARAEKEGDGAGVIAPPPSGIIASFGRLGGAYRVAATAAKILTASVLALSVALTALYSYVAYKTSRMVLNVVKGFMTIRETFRQYEISLGGIIRNTEATAKIMKFATKYAAEYPAMFEDVIDAVRGLASMPTLKPLFRKAEFDDLKGIMDIVQGLATLKPQQGVQGAMMALREALSGQMRSLRMRFEVNVREMAEAAGFSFTEITHDAGKALEAISQFVQLNVPAAAMASMAKTISVQYGNLYDKYRTFVNEMMKTSGAYWAVVEALQSLNDWLTKVFESSVVVEFARQVSNTLREIVSMFEVAMSGFEWKKYLESGDIVGAVKDFCNRIKMVFTVLWEEFGEEATKAVRIVVGVLWGILKPVFGLLASTFWKMIEAGAGDAGRISAKLFAIGFKEGTKDLGSWLYKKYREPEKMMGEWEEKLGKEKERKRLIGYGISPEIVDKWAGEKQAEKEAKRAEVVAMPKTAEPALSPVAKIWKEADEELEKILQKFAKDMREGRRISKPEPMDVGGDLYVPPPTHYAGAELEREALKTMEKQRELKAAIVETENKINTIITKRGKNTQELVDLEFQLGNLTTQRIQAEDELLQIAKKQKESVETIAELKRHGSRDIKALIIAEKESIKHAQDRIKAEQQIIQGHEAQRKIKAQILALDTQIVKKLASTGVITSFYSSWKDVIKKMSQSTLIKAGTMIPFDAFGQGGQAVGWREGTQKGRRGVSGEYRGVPTFLTTLMERLQGALGTETSVAGKEKLTTGLMGLYKEAAGYAKGRGAKTALAMEAMGLLPKLLNLQTTAAKGAEIVQQAQLDTLKAQNIEGAKQTVVLFDIHEALMRALQKKARANSSASIGNQKITGANPATTPLLESVL